MKGIVRVSKLKFVLVALDVNPAATMFVVVIVPMTSVSYTHLTLPTNREV